MLKTKTRTILLSLLTIFILTVFIFLFFVILKNPSLSESSVSSVFLVNVITITLIFLLLLVLVVKSIIRLIYQRRQNILGSRLNAKLVFIMLLLVLIPTVPTYFIIGPIINNIFNVWNQKRIRDAVDSSIGISRSYLQNEEKYLKISLSNFIDKTKLNIKMKSLTSSDKVNLENRIKEDGYKEVYIFDLHRKEVFRYPAESQKEFTDKELASVFEDINSLPQTEINIERDILDCYYPVFYKENFRGILIVSKELDTDALLQIKKIEETAREYNSLIKFGRRSYSFIINLSFLAISLVLLFLTFWISFYIAKQITIPVEALLIGTEKVAQGDLDVHIDVQTSDELGNLVDSFNKMVKDIHDLNIKNEEYTKFISSILQNINAGVIALSKEKKIVEINQAAKDLLHLDSGRDLDCFKDLFEDEGNFTLADSLLEECLKSKKEVCHQEVIMNINGK
ncbi:MAG: HAMP domain-containing protein, partial [bacterium]|nr:HAMP domain-containing protein [bacterium]